MPTSGKRIESSLCTRPIWGNSRHWSEELAGRGASWEDMWSPLPIVHWCWPGGGVWIPLLRARPSRVSSRFAMTSGLPLGPSILSSWPMSSPRSVPRTTRSTSYCSTPCMSSVKCAALNSSSATLRSSFWGMWVISRSCETASTADHRSGR